jgi:hypothetical protein
MCEAEVLLRSNISERFTADQATQTSFSRQAPILLLYVSIFISAFMRCLTDRMLGKAQGE